MPIAPSGALSQSLVMRAAVDDAGDIGRIIRQRRLALGLTQEQLARRAGVSRRWWGELERGATHVEMALVMRAIAECGLALQLVCVA